ncbi:NitT/TauT family transport system permease protein [Melghirimyces profundicolus]|uniref:NitT/TauT family transport system permease protein n=1 Tax=Melghirimyces profundicolus TaxID=1242148 RepID=A0A2T6BTR4_9BACL|nr:ABC transporter permease [Melghirimyces profundicolus]PTX59367.1 NitT/TauT family transport system permease protein [Melghirimyces profundicolus]
MKKWLETWLTRGAKSDAHARYLRRLRLTDGWVNVTRLGILALFVAVWEIGAEKGWIDPFLFSSPGRIWDLFLRMAADGGLFQDIGITVLETVIGFVLGTAAGTGLATLIWLFPFLSRVLDPYLVVLNSMPKVALGPLFIVTIGAGFGSVLAMGVAITVIITTLVIHSSFQSVDPNYLKLARALGANRRQLFCRIIFPACIPDMIAALKVNVGLAWVGVIVGEFLVSKNGLGHLIIYGFQVFNLTLVLLSLLIVAILATVMYQLVFHLEKRLLRHRQLE